MAQVEGGRPFESVSDQGGDLNKQVQRCTQDDAVDQAADAVARHKEEGAGDLPHVVHAGGNGRQQKMLVGLQAGHHQAANRKQDRTDQVQPHQVGYQLALFRTKTRRDPDLRVDDRLGKNSHQDGNAACRDKGQVGHAREQVPGGGAALCGEVFAHQRDKGHGQGTARDQGKKHIRQVVGRVERVEQLD